VKITRTHCYPVAGA